MKLTEEHIQELIAELDKQVYKEPLVLCSPRFREQLDEALREYCTPLINRNDKETED